MNLRPHQDESVAAVMHWITQNIEPVCMTAATGFGKSYVVADVARQIHDMSGKKVLCIQPSAELVEQNIEKFRLTGKKASVYCASISKSLRHDVIFCTPQSIKAVIKKLHCAAVIIDECHNLTPTIKSLVESLRALNPNLRVIGLSATPYRLGTGYIYKYDNEREMENAVDPYFKKNVYTSDPRELIKLGYLSPVEIGAINSESYDVAGLQMKGYKFTADSVEQAFVGKGRKTAAIIADVVSQSRDSKGVLVFASTVQHAEECMESLPHGSRIVTGNTPKDERAAIIKGLKEQRIKYVVNVACLTTGLDVTHIETIAILRATESSALLSQIIGRGMRTHPDKQNCLVLDYADNISRHYPDSDIFNPKITAYNSNKEGAPIEINCPLCNVVNEFTLRPNDDGYPMDSEGYFIDLDGNRIKNDSDVEIPGHYGRRCFGVDNNLNRCDYRWSSKDCHECQIDNDIAARYCRKCKAEIVDPNDKLIADYIAMKKDPHQTQCDEVLDVAIMETLTKKGDPMHVAEFTLANRNVKLYMPDLPYPSAQKKREDFKAAYVAGIKTITYYKNKDFWSVIAYNQEPDRQPELIK